MLSRLSVVFAAGCLGGLATVITLFLFGWIGISDAMGVALAPPLTPPMIYSFMIWGGIWGFLFFVFPLVSLNIFLRGLLFSIAPTIIECLVVLPLKMHAGWGGVHLGMWMPLLVVIFNAVWGITTALWLTLQDSGVVTAGRDRSMP